jgi:RNA polymerase sigma-70 factor (ECF subfamily)
MYKEMYADGFRKIMLPTADDPDSLDALSDAALLERLRQGDHAALGVLFDRYYPHIYRTAYGVMGDRHDAEDIAQNAFLRLYRYVWRIDPARPLTPWLYRVTINLACSELARRSRKRLIAVDSIIESAIAPRGESPESIVARREQAAYIVSALRQLPEKQLTAVILFYLNDLHVEQIAEVVNCPIDTVKTRLFHARKALRAALAQLRAREDYSDVQDDEWITHVLRSAFQ